ncbi:hypothetical protein DMA11_15205 [Marinilabiliaceae bacterium JC017]|nr:hypothetical protein DMA11_15205 [Marinilabiliaceae bacterium JC017]
MNTSVKLFSSSYFGPIQFFAHLNKAAKGIIEQHCHYTKQTYRNRCVILGANGTLPLTIPVEKGKTHKTSMKEVIISYDTPWQNLHWRSIVSAYNSSPFFEYYQDDFQPFFEKHWKYLLDYNMAILKQVLEILEMESNIELSDHWYEIPVQEITDLREIIHPKKSYLQADHQFTPQAYRQVFAEKFDFIPNLSILDLIFNKGPEAIDVLDKSLSNT